jgi:hypothetical protein
MDEEFSSALLTGCVLLASRCWALPRKTCRTIHPPHADQPAAEGKPRRAPAPTNERSSRAPGLILVGHEVELTTAQPPPDDDGQVQTETSAGPAPPAPASSTRLRLRQTTSRAWTQRATTPTPAIPAVRLPAHRRAPGPHFGRTQRTRQRTDTGRPHRTLDTVPWTGKRGYWSLAPDTGHRTLAEDADR